MAARGSVAKENIKHQIANAFGENYIGEVGGKVYLWANDGGERVQIALALTCPKTFIEVPDNQAPQKVEDWDFSDNNETKENPSSKKTMISEEEKQKIADLMKSLGL